MTVADSRSDGVTIRRAEGADAAAVRAFGIRVVPPYYEELIGAGPARALIDEWWQEEQLEAAALAGNMVVAECDGAIIGMAEVGCWADEWTIYKLYVDAEHRGGGIGPRLMNEVVMSIPEGVTEVSIEHFAANESGARFYEREGFRVDHIDEDPSGDPALAVVWRKRAL